MAEITWPWQYNFPPFLLEMKLMGKSWQYISEGNVHIVIQLKDTNYVLRLIKQGIKPVLAEDLKKALNFVNLVMVPLSKNHSYGVAKLIDISDYNLDELSKELEVYRPAKRLFKSILSPFVIKTSNLSIVSAVCKSNYCIEIKPKEGFICSSLKEYSKCYYCLKQYYKVHNQDIQEISAYCPLDLFSGNTTRMHFALQSMMKNPQNNFKLFKNGKLINQHTLYSTHGQNEDIILPFQTKDILINFVIEVLLAETSNFTNTFKETGNESESLDSNSKIKQCNDCNILKPNNILHNLLQLQKLSENIVLKDSDMCNNDYDYVYAVLNEIKSMSLDLNSQKDRDLFFSTTEPLHLALISAIAKDCSIMISFSTDFVDNTPYVDIQELDKMSRVYYKSALTDLEPKPITTLLKRKIMESKLIEMYKKHIVSLNKE